jgi:hypothetical protein
MTTPWVGVCRLLSIKASSKGIAASKSSAEPVRELAMTFVLPAYQKVDGPKGRFGFLEKRVPF